MSQQINLYRPIFRKQRKVFSARAMVQALGLMAAAIALAYVFLSMRTGLLDIQARQSAQQLKSELELLKVSAGGASPAERAKALAERRKALEASIAAQTQALEAFRSGAGHAEGPAKQLRVLARLSLEGVWLTRIEFGEGAAEMSLAGRALRPELVARYVERLRADPQLEAQQFTGLEITRPAAPAKGGASAKGEAPVSFVDFALSSGEREAKK